MDIYSATVVVMMFVVKLESDPNFSKPFIPSPPLPSGDGGGSTPALVAALPRFLPPFLRHVQGGATSRRAASTTTIGGWGWQHSRAFSRGGATSCRAASRHRGNSRRRGNSLETYFHTEAALQIE